MASQTVAFEPKTTISTSNYQPPDLNRRKEAMKKLVQIDLGEEKK
jgi:hypothetical protein